LFLTSERIGVVGLVLFALFAYLGVGIANIGLALMLVAALLQWRQFGRALKPAPLPQLSAGVLALVGLSTVLAVVSRPTEAGDQWAGFGDVIQLWLFLLPAWWIAGREARTVLILTLAVVGFALGAIKALEPGDLEALLTFQRPHFRWSINAFGQYSAAGFMGIVLLLPRLWRRSAGERWVWWARAAGLAMAAWMLAGTVLSLSRGVWLAFLVVGCGLVVAGWRLRRPQVATHTGRWIALGLGLALLAVLVPGNPVATRLIQIVEPFAQFVAADGDLGAVDDISFRERFGIVTLGVESWRQSPWVGLGPAGPERIIRANRDRFVGGQSYTDFHAMALDLLVAFGVLGTLALLALFVAVLRWTWLGYRGGCLPLDLYLLLTGLTVFNVLCQMTDTRLFSVHGRFFWILIAGAACSCWLNGRRMDGRSHNPDAPAARRATRCP
jgi:O-antigen ligase